MSPSAAEKLYYRVENDLMEIIKDTKDSSTTVLEDQEIKDTILDYVKHFLGAK